MAWKVKCEVRFIGLKKNGQKYNLSEARILTLRRHEKDYIIRKENQYLDKLKKAVLALETDIKQKVKNEAEEKQLLHNLSGLPAGIFRFGKNRKANRVS